MQMVSKFQMDFVQIPYGIGILFLWPGTLLELGKIRYFSCRIARCAGLWCSSSLYVPTILLIAIIIPRVKDYFEMYLKKDYLKW